MNDLLRGKKVIALVFAIQQAGAQNHLPILEKLAGADPAPFVIVEGSGEDTKGRAQGVIISPKGHVLSVGHIAWIDADKSFTDKLVFWQRKEKFGIAVDPVKERQRIREAQALGKPLNSKSIPVISRKKKALFEGVLK